MSSHSITAPYPHHASSVTWQGAEVFLGRALFALIFIMSGVGHFSQSTIGYAAHQGVPLAEIAVPLSGVLALAGGLSVLLGYRVRLGAWLLILFLVPVTLTMHNFWAAADPMAAKMQQAMFMKNVALIGGALLLAHFGAGPWSLDARRRVSSSGRG
jgi:putative oxidoreductase